MKMKIFLTGATGMVGRNFLEHPDISDFTVFAPSRAELDLRDFEAICSYLERHQPDIVVHAAGKVGGIQANMREPVEFLLENMDIGRNIVWAARQARIKKLLNLGSSCMYPRDYKNPMKEELILKGELEPTNEGYALAKVVIARFCEYVTREYPAYQYKTLIPCNLYGRHDKFDPAYSHLIPAIIHKIHQAKQNNQEHVVIWGDGTARREFMYVADFTDALVRAIRTFDLLPSVMNIGLGHDYSISEYYHVVADVLGFPGSFIYDIRKPVGMARKLLDVQKQGIWGWNAVHNLRVGIEKTYQFYLKESAT